MRRVSILFALAIPLLSACNRQLIEPDSASGETGNVIISLTASERVDIVSVKSGIDTPVPDKNDFWVEFINSSGVKFFKKKYSEVEGETIGMNVGDFTLIARHGDSLGVGFDKPFFMAKTPFTVKPNVTNEITAEAKLANVKVAVTYNDHIREGYSNYYAVVEHLDYAGKSLTFSKTEDRAGYIPKGRLSLTVYAEVNGELKCHTPKDMNGNPKVFDCAPNDFVTFNIRTGENTGNMIFDIKIDDGVELHEQTIEVPADAVSNTRPSIVLSSCDEDGVYYITEGVQGAPADLGFTYKANAGIKSCRLTVDSDYLSGLGVPSDIDVMNMDAAARASLENLGFFFAATSNVGVVGFEDVVNEYSRTAVYQGGGKPTEVAVLTLSMTDNDDETVTETIRVYVKPDGAASIILNDYDVWATKVVNPVVRVTKGNPALMMVESSLDGKTWSDFMQVTSADFQMGTITGLTPSTNYYLRVVYDDWMVISDVLSLTTEAAQQVGNAGFEDYQLVQTKFTPMASSSYTRNWYLPYKQGETDPWWACNSMQSMPDNHTGMSVNWCKNFPSSGYVTDCHSGSKAALMYCVNIGNTNTANTHPGTVYEGEIWIGTADGSGNIATQGHAFSSRPAKLTFWYKYSPNSSNKFFVDSWVKASDDQIIATAQETAGPAASNWTKHTLTYNYTSTTKKASKIFIRISSCYGNGSVSTRKTFTLGTESVEAHAGSFLMLDDIELVYE